jgi:Uri superfamily endonuclease
MVSSLNETIKTIPSLPGTYLLWLYLPQATSLKVGKLWEFDIPTGDYVYLGSAHGPGGLRARLGRHLRGNGKPHWHIDYLRAATQVRGFGYTIHHRGRQPRIPMECAWSQKLAALRRAALPDGRIVAPCFGASDCRSGCAAHLVFIPKLDIDQISPLLNCEIRILRAD